MFLENSVRLSVFKLHIIFLFFPPIPQLISELVLVDSVVSHVNQHVITLHEVLELMAPIRSEIVHKFDGKEQKEKLETVYKQTLDAIIERNLVLDLYNEGKGKLPEWLIDQQSEDFIREEFAGNRSKLLEALAKEKITYVEWREKIGEELIIASMRNVSIFQNINVSPEAISKYHQNHISEFRLEEKIQLRMIMLLRDRSLDLEYEKQRVSMVLSRLHSGEDFETVAKEESDGVYADTGGDWGWIEPHVLLNVLSDSVRELGVGEVSDLIETGGEYYILKLEGRSEASVMPFQEAHLRIESALRRKEGERLYKEWIQRLRNNAYIKVFDIKVFRS